MFFQRPWVRLANHPPLLGGPVNLDGIAAVGATGARSGFFAGLPVSAGPLDDDRVNDHSGGVDSGVNYDVRVDDSRIDNDVVPPATQDDRAGRIAAVTTVAAATAVTATEVAAKAAVRAAAVTAAVR